MTRTLYRRDSVFMRFVSAFVALSFTLSLTGSGYAAPSAPETDATEMEATAPVEATPEAPVEVAEEPAAVETAAEPAPDPAPVEEAEPPAEEEPAKSVEEAPTTAEPAAGDTGEAAPAASEAPDSSDSKVSAAPRLKSSESNTTKLSAAAAPITTASTDIGSGDVNLEGVRQGTGWVKGNLQTYKEGQYAPFRLWVDKQTTDKVLPALTVDAVHYIDGKGIYFDKTKDYYYYLTDQKPDIGDVTAPQGSWTPATLVSHDVPVGGAFGVDADSLQTVIDGGIGVPAGKYVVIYFRARLALTAFWNTQTPPRDGWGPYNGSPGNMQIDGLGRKTVPLPAVEGLSSQVVVNKFYDEDGDGEPVQNQEVLTSPSFVMTLDDTGESNSYDIPLIAKSTVNGVATFGPLPDGQYVVAEDDSNLTDGWVNTTGPQTITVAPGDTETRLGRQLPAPAEALDRQERHLGRRQR